MIQVTQLNDYNLKRWLDIFIGPIGWTLTGTTTPDQSGTESNSNEGVLDFLKAQGMESHHQMQFTVIPRTAVGEGASGGVMVSKPRLANLH